MRRVLANFIMCLCIVAVGCTATTRPETTDKYPKSVKRYSPFVCQPGRTVDVDVAGNAKLTILGKDVIYTNEFCFATWRLDSGTKSRCESGSYLAAPAYFEKKNLCASYSTSWGGNKINISQIDSGKIIKSFQTSCAVESITFSHDGNSLLICGGRFFFPIFIYGYAELWDMNSDAIKFTFANLNGPIYSSAFSMDDKKIALGSGNSTAAITRIFRGKVHLIDAKTGATLKTFRPDLGWVSSLSFSPDNLSLAIGGNAGPVELWNVSPLRKALTLDDNSVGPCNLLYGLHPGHLIVGGAGEVSLWDTFSGEKLKGFISPSAMGPVALSNDDRILLTQIIPDQAFTLQVRQWRVLSRP